jgi:hypothetical protein
MTDDFYRGAAGGESPPGGERRGPVPDGTADDAGRESVAPADAFEALAVPRRRHLVRALAAAGEGVAVPVRDLATEVAARERGVEASRDRVAEAERGSVEVALSHAHLPRLVDLGVIDCRASDAGVVAVPGPDVVRLADVLDAVEATIEA